MDGNGNYGFWLTALREQINAGGGVDKFRIKKGDKNNNDTVAYNSQIGNCNEGPFADSI